MLGGMTTSRRPEAVEQLLSKLGRKYVWWKPVGAADHSRDRIIAQIMNFGTYKDIRALEKALGSADLARVARRAAAGWFSLRSWEFWRGRLAAAGLRVPPKPPRRSFDAPQV